ncbi:hypothetical protein SteCoe_37734 [Stentor coeruleus]|uniref:Uncharacterized protein n=1 Tax=Stentor coeruleus TaxID=5963 RepID=A0A1R2AMG9_9CILI|nr:hypothetical protein SteCoe_37734 [Stentor coeruleus]
MYGKLSPDSTAKNISIHYCFSPFAPKNIIRRVGTELYKPLPSKTFDTSPSINTDPDESNYINSFPNLPIIKSSSKTTRKEFISIVDFSTITSRNLSNKPEISLKSRIKPNHFSKIVKGKSKKFINLKEFIVKPKPIVKKKIEIPVNSEETMKNSRKSVKSYDFVDKDIKKDSNILRSPGKSVRTLTPVVEILENLPRKEPLRKIYLPRIQKKIQQANSEHLRSVSVKDTVFQVMKNDDIDLRGW